MKPEFALDKTGYSCFSPQVALSPSLKSQTVSNDLYATRWQHHDIDKKHFYFSPSKANFDKLKLAYMSLRSNNPFESSRSKS